MERGSSSQLANKASDKSSASSIKGKSKLKSAIKQASWAVSNRPGSQGAELLTIIADDIVDIAMPQDKLAIADAIVAAVRPNIGSTYSH